MLKMGIEKQMIRELFFTIFFFQEVAIGFCVGFLFFIYIEGGVVFFLFLGEGGVGFLVVYMG